LSDNSFGRLFRVTTWGESHGPAIGCVIDGCPPRLAVSEADIQPWLDKRRPGTSRFVTQRREPDTVRILSGVYQGLTTGTPIALLVENEDARSKDYANIADAYRPGHADFTYDAKYGHRDPRGGGRSSARETAMRVAAGAVARTVLGPRIRIRAAVIALGGDPIAAWDDAEIDRNPFWSPDPQAAARWADALDAARANLTSLGALIEVRVDGVPPGWGAPIYGKLDAAIAGALMGINAVKGVEIGDGFAAAAARGHEQVDAMVPSPLRPSGTSPKGEGEIPSPLGEVPPKGAEGASPPGRCPPSPATTRAVSSAAFPPARRSSRGSRSSPPPASPARSRRWDATARRRRSSPPAATTPASASARSPSPRRCWRACSRTRCCNTGRRWVRR